MSCPNCNHIEFNTVSTTHSSVHRTTIKINNYKINPDELNDAVRFGILNSDISWSEFSIHHNFNKPKRSFSDHPVVFIVSIIMIVLWSAAKSIGLAIFALIVLIYCFGKIEKKNRQEQRKKDETYERKMESFKPSPPSIPENKIWQYWVWMLFCVFAPAIFSKGDETGFEYFFMKTVQIIGLIGFPLAWKTFKTGYKLNYSRKMKAFEKTMDNWASMIMCRKCGHIYINPTSETK